MMMTAELAFAGGACGRELSPEEIGAVCGGYSWLEFAADLGVASGVCWTAAEAASLGMNPAAWTAAGVLGLSAAILATGAAGILAYYTHAAN